LSFPSLPAHTNDTTLEATIARLAAHPRVDGLLLMGTTGTSALTPTSDYDLLLVLDGTIAPLNLVQTWIDGRLAEIYCTSVAALERIMFAVESWSDRSEAGIIVRWLRDGRIALDRTDRLRQAQELARAAPPPTPVDEPEIYGAWRSIGYNVAQTKRYLASDDLVAQEAVDWRLLYGLSEVQGHYFTIRQLPWRGEKAAISYLAEHDPDFLARLRRCLIETDRRHKVAQYEDLARHAVAPVGDLWATGTTVVAPGPGFGADNGEENGSVELALAFWHELVAEPKGYSPSQQP
jgi:hypothetical protein